MKITILIILIDLLLNKSETSTHMETVVYSGAVPPKEKWMKYLITYYEDEFTIVAETEVAVNNIVELESAADKYYKENLEGKHNLCGCRWTRIDWYQSWVWF